MAINGAEAFHWLPFVGNQPGTLEPRHPIGHCSNIYHETLTDITPPTTCPAGRTSSRPEEEGSIP